MIPTKKEMLDALKKRQGETLTDKFLSATVAVCGLGGLGSNVAIALARANVGRLILIDFDKVEISNLHRQQYKASQIGKYKTDAIAEILNEIAPYVELNIHTVRINENNVTKLLKPADVICEAFDDPACKAMLANSVLQMMPEKFLISASGMAGIGKANSIKTRRISNQFYVCGDEISEANNDVSLISSRVMLCASHQAHTVLRVLVNKFEV